MRRPRTGNIEGILPVFPRRISKKCCIRSRLANLSKSRKRMDRRALVVLGTNVKPFDNTEISMGDKVWLERLTICLERSRIF